MIPTLQPPGVRPPGHWMHERVGTAQHYRPLAPLVWFKSGGTAEHLFEPADADDLVQFLRQLDAHVPVMALGLGSNMIVRDGGVPGASPCADCAP